ncbi:hypothetical protein M3Y99_01608300 [Aphelenchoides fujianensis]|nr:hypothetical protein M3Y99_01608300 [Aphelenchoides fujianensis]
MEDIKDKASDVAQNIKEGAQSLKEKVVGKVPRDRGGGQGQRPERQGPHQQLSRDGTTPSTPHVIPSSRLHLSYVCVIFPLPLFS